MAEIIEIVDEGEAQRFKLRAPESLAKFMVSKGSVALNGTSLTINELEGSTFDVLLIRHTLEVTTWGGLKVGDQVNIEVDQLARYVVRLMEHQQQNQ